MTRWVESGAIQGPAVADTVDDPLARSRSEGLLVRLTDGLERAHPAIPVPLPANSIVRALMVVHEVAHVVHPVDDIRIDQARIWGIPSRLRVTPRAGASGLVLVVLVVGTRPVFCGVHWVVLQCAREVDGRHRAEGVGTLTATDQLGAGGGRRVAASVGVVAAEGHVGGLLEVPVVLRGTILNILGATGVVSVRKLTGRYGGRHVASVV